MVRQTRGVFHRHVSFSRGCLNSTFAFFKENCYGDTFVLFVNVVVEYTCSRLIKYWFMSGLITSLVSGKRPNALPELWECKNFTDSTENQSFSTNVFTQLKCVQTIFSSHFHAFIIDQTSINTEPKKLFIDEYILHSIERLFILFFGASAIW